MDKLKIKKLLKTKELSKNDLPSLLVSRVRKDVIPNNPLETSALNK